jgi:hypothetical protein
MSCPGRDAARSSCEALLRRTGTPLCKVTGAPALQHTAPQELRAALRPGHASGVMLRPSHPVMADPPFAAVGVTEQA